MNLVSVTLFIDVADRGGRMDKYLLDLSGSLQVFEILVHFDSTKSEAPIYTFCLYIYFICINGIS